MCCAVCPTKDADALYWSFMLLAKGHLTSSGQNSCVFITSTMGHSFTRAKIMKACREHQRLLVMMFIDHRKAIDTAEHFAVVTVRGPTKVKSRAKISERLHIVPNRLGPKTKRNPLSCKYGCDGTPGKTYGCGAVQRYKRVLVTS